jgi:hypothetical protein
MLIRGALGDALVHLHHLHSMSILLPYTLGRCLYLWHMMSHAVEDIDSNCLESIDTVLSALESVMVLPPAYLGTWALRLCLDGRSAPVLLVSRGGLEQPEHLRADSAKARACSFYLLCDFHQPLYRSAARSCEYRLAAAFIPKEEVRSVTSPNF